MTNPRKNPAQDRKANAHKTGRRLVTPEELPSFGISYSRTHIRRLIAKGLFPQSVQVSPNRIAYWSDELDEWKEALPRRDYRTPIKGKKKPKSNPDDTAEKLTKSKDATA
jgi:predicted DNA-binding transcriptional regulator AlpA